jgi:hypothetical protein
VPSDVTRLWLVGPIEAASRVGRVADMQRSGTTLRGADLTPGTYELRRQIGSGYSTGGTLQARLGGPTSIGYASLSWRDLGYCGQVDPALVSQYALPASYACSGDSFVPATGGGEMTLAPGEGGRLTVGEMASTAGMFGFLGNLSMNQKIGLAAAGVAVVTTGIVVAVTGGTKAGASAAAGKGASASATRSSKAPARTSKAPRKNPGRTGRGSRRR